MKAFIDPLTSPISYVSSWTSTYPYSPIFSEYPNSWRVAQVEPDDKIFPIAEPYFWADCADNVVADQFYYDSVTQTIKPIVNIPSPPKPASVEQPTTTGTVTL